MNNADRFIPDRSAMNMDAAHLALISDHAGENTYPAPDCRILQYKKSIPNQSMSSSAVDGSGVYDPMMMLKKQAALDKTRTSRILPQSAIRQLDAPNILDDFYLNIMDWGPSNVLSVALNRHVYLWYADECQVQELVALESFHATAVRWVDGNHLCVGVENGPVRLFDTQPGKIVRTLRGHQDRVSAIACHRFLVATGSRDAGRSNLLIHDIRAANSIVASLSAHTQEVCGLQWSPNGKELASGANDNTVCIWDTQMLSTTSTASVVNNSLSATSVQGNNSHALFSATAPRLVLAQHKAAVKALAWSPNAPHTLASGGGAADRTLRVWNTTTGHCQTSVDTKSQVAAVVWNASYNEIATGHGFSDNLISLWQCPQLKKVGDLQGHRGRILAMCASPDGQLLAAADAHEEILIWDAFKRNSVKEQERGSASSMLLMNGSDYKTKGGLMEGYSMR